MSVRTVMVRHGEVAIETLQQGEGPAIVILPSLGRDGLDDYDVCAAALAADGFCVLRPQPRGIGRSVGPMQGVLVPELAADIAEVIRQRAADGRAVIVGHAYGNIVARMTATAHPDRVRGVVLAAAAARDVPPAIAAAPATAGNPQRPEAERLQALRLAFFAPGHDARTWLNGWYPATQAMQAASSRGAVTRGVWWAAGSAPVLDLIPELDPFKPRDQWQQMRDEFGPRIDVRTIADASHALFPEQPLAVAEAIRGWVRALP